MFFTKLGFSFDDAVKYICYLQSVTTSTHYACSVVTTEDTNFVIYTITVLEQIPANTELLVTLALLDTELFTFPPNIGLYLVKVAVNTFA